MNIKSVTVFCGATFGTNSAFEKDAYEFGKQLAEHDITLVYGGGAIGMMGTVADGAVDHDGHVIGVIPQFLVDRELAHPQVQDMRTVQTMHERKAMMNELGDAIVALPGGAGTLEELFEMYTWGQIGLHQKPIGLMDTQNFFTELMQLFDKLIDTGFLDMKYMSQIFQGDSLDDLLKQFDQFIPVSVRTYKDLQKGRRS